MKENNIVKNDWEDVDNKFGDLVFAFRDMLSGYFLEKIKRESKIKYKSFTIDSIVFDSEKIVIKAKCKRKKLIDECLFVFTKYHDNEE